MDFFYFCQYASALKPLSQILTLEQIKNVRLTKDRCTGFNSPNFRLQRHDDSTIELITRGGLRHHLTNTKNNNQ